MTHSHREATDPPSGARALLLDVGGTLWPNVWRSGEGDLDDRVERVLGVAPGLGRAEAGRLVSALLRNVTTPRDGGPQRTDAEIASTVRALGLSESCPDAAELRRAVCQPAAGRVTLFDGAEQMLHDAVESGFRIALISNAVWRDGATCLSDFADLGIADLIDASFSSVEIGYRKPHPAMFEAALAALRCPARGSVVIGDSEINDMVPARELRMFTIRVAIEASAPSASCADHVVTSLGEVPALLVE